MKPKVSCDVDKSLKEERKAVRDYASRAKAARRSGDKATAKVFSHLRKEEMHHIRELKKRV